MISIAKAFVDIIISVGRYVIKVSSLIILITLSLYFSLYVYLRFPIKKPAHCTILFILIQQVDRVLANYIEEGGGKEGTLTLNPCIPLPVDKISIYYFQNQNINIKQNQNINFQSSI